MSNNHCTCYRNESLISSTSSDVCFFSIFQETVEEKNNYECIYIYLLPKIKRIMKIVDAVENLIHLNLQSNCELLLI